MIPHAFDRETICGAFISTYIVVTALVPPPKQLH